jgi:hypothetical protein
MIATAKKNKLTSEPLAVPPRVITTPIEPETIRLPENGGVDPYFGLKRSALNTLILPTQENNFKPPVKSFVLRKKGARTGIRLIGFQSLREYIYSHAERAA